MATRTQQRRHQDTNGGWGHNRIKDFLEHDEQEVRSGQVKLTEASKDADVEELLERNKAGLMEREDARKIKLHDRTPEDFQPAKKSEAKVLTTRGKRPDMRIAAHRGMYQRDPSMRKDGKTPDARFLEHRPDLLRYREEQASSTAGVVFEDD